MEQVDSYLRHDLELQGRNIDTRLRHLTEAVSTLGSIVRELERRVDALERSPKTREETTP